jgi:DNA-binding CsgD family transcriptional regulator
MAIHFPTPSTAPRDAETCTAVFNLLARLYSGAAARPLGGEAALNPMDHPSAQIAAAHHAAQRAAALEVLDSLPFGVIALDVRRQVRLINVPAQRFIDSAQVLEIRDGLIAAAASEDAGVLEGLVRHLHEREALPFAGGHVTLRRRWSQQSARLLVLVSTGAHIDELLVVLLCPDPARIRMLATVLVDLFGLTPIESQLAMLMLEGLTIEEAARVRHVTTKTARAQWQTVLWKIAADSEHQVMSLLRTALALPIPPSGHRP